MALSLKLKHLFVLGFLLLCSSVLSHGDPTVCSKVFEFGGPSALLHSPECSHWKFPDLKTPTPMFCQTATLQGRQKYQQDRVLCTLDLQMPLPGKRGTEDVQLGVTGVFEGHNGTEASNMISKMFLDYFSVNSQYLAHKKQMASSDVVGNDSFQLEVLKEGLVGSIKEIGAILATEAKKRKHVSDSTATVALLVDGQIIVANVGDSKAFLCSKKALSSTDAAKGSFLKQWIQKRSTPIVVKELTRDRHLDKVDEISGSIGAISDEGHEVISTPEVTEWQHLTVEDGYLVTASDGVFEKMSSEDACELLWEAVSISQETSMADRLVNTAFEKGSMDNLAAVVVPLRINHPPSEPEEEEESTYQKIPRTNEL